MASVTDAEIQRFLQRLGDRYSGKTDLYLLGGGALCLLGNARPTLDLDYTTGRPEEVAGELERLIEGLAREMKLDIEAVPLDEFIPLPAGASTRHRLVSQYGGLSVYIYDLYSIALSKVARGFETDLEDVLFLLRQQLVELEQLAAYVAAALGEAWTFDIDPADLERHLAELRRMYAAGP